MARGVDRKMSQATRSRDRQDLVDDLTALRAAVIALCTKLDADGGTSDTDYTSTLTPAALKTLN